jgi:hypothetical protein
MVVKISAHVNSNVVLQEESARITPRDKIISEAVGNMQKRRPWGGTTCKHTNR